jgi:hypothetical protein
VSPEEREDLKLTAESLRDNILRAKQDLENAKTRVAVLERNVRTQQTLVNLIERQLRYAKNDDVRAAFRNE